MESSPHIRHSDVLQILACRIVIWESKSKFKYEKHPKDFRGCMVINECVDIEIEDTYKKLITNAVVKLAKGTVVRHTITPETPNKSKVYTERMNDGAILEKRMDGGAVAQTTDFRVGQRISIYLGYYQDTEVYYQNNKKRQQAIDAALDHDPDFDGYIVKCSASTPIEIKCENLASCLKLKSCKEIPARDHVKVNDLFKAGGNVDLLAGTGLTLYPQTEHSDIDIGRVALTKDWTVADLLAEWNQYHLYSFIRIENGIPYVVIGRSYFSGKPLNDKKDPSVIVDIDKNTRGTLIQFDYDVAKDNLTLMHVDPMFLAVEAQCATSSGKFYRVTVALNPEYDNTNPESSKFRLINETNLNRKTLKLMGVVGSKIREKVDLSQYTVVPYMSRKIGITKEELVKEAKAYFEGYNCNGVEGSLTVFGDHHLHSGCKVELLDELNPGKNGWYLVDEVTTKFGTSGFRQTIKLPYCIAKPKSKNNGQD